MKYIIVGIIAGLLSFIVNVKAQEGIKTETRTYMKTLLCASHTDLVNNLNTEHKEARKWWAVNSDNELIELITKRAKIYSKAQFKIDCHKLKKTEIVNKILKIYESN